MSLFPRRVTGERHPTSRRKSRPLTTQRIDHNTRKPYSPNSRLVSLRHHWSAWLVPSALLLLALLPWPYGYYNFLRLAVCLVAAWFTYEQWKLDDAISGWVVALGATALLYNPLFPIHLNREMWSVLNLASAVVFLGHLISLRRLIITPPGSDLQKPERTSTSVLGTQEHPVRAPRRQ